MVEVVMPMLRGDLVPGVTVRGSYADKDTYIIKRSWPPTEKTLQWCRENIPHFATCEKQAREARRFVRAETEGA